MWQVVWNKMQLATDLSPTTVGNVREFFVREFLSLHLPGDLSVGTGHVLAERDESQQIDVLVFRRSGLALPMGNVSLVFPEGLVACMEVKSTLTKEDFRGQIATMFGNLPPPAPGEPIPLKAVIAVQLENSSQHRSLLEKWRKCVKGSVNEIVIFPRDIGPRVPRASRSHAGGAATPNALGCPCSSARGSRPRAGWSWSATPGLTAPAKGRQRLLGLQLLARAGFKCT
jgi:hypothetical protein